MESNGRAYTTRWPVRLYELDVNGHVNNAVYLNYAEQVATEHAQSLGFGRQWALAHAGTWVARRHEITYRRPATFGDVLELTTRVEEMRGARAVRRTTIVHAESRETVTEIVTEWAWLRLPEARPARIPEELIQAFQGEGGRRPAHLV